MKRIIALAVVSLMVMCIMPFATDAEMYESDGEVSNTAPTVDSVKILDKIGGADITGGSLDVEVDYVVEIKVTDQNWIGYEEIKLNMTVRRHYYMLEWEEDNRPDIFYKYNASDRDASSLVDMTDASQKIPSNKDYFEDYFNSFSYVPNGNTGAYYYFNFSLNDSAESGQWHINVNVEDDNGATDGGYATFTVNTVFGVTVSLSGGSFTWPAAGAGATVESSPFTVTITGNMNYEITANYSSNFTGTKTGYLWNSNGTLYTGASLKGKVDASGAVLDIPNAETDTPESVTLYASTRIPQVNEIGVREAIHQGSFLLTYPDSLPDDAYTGLKVNVTALAVT